MKQNKIKKILSSRIMASFALLALFIVVFFFMPIYEQETYLYKILSQIGNHTTSTSILLTKDYITMSDFVFGEAKDYYYIEASTYSIVLGMIALTLLIAGLICGIYSADQADKKLKWTTKVLGAAAWLISLYVLVIMRKLDILLVPALVIICIKKVCPIRKICAFCVIIAYMIFDILIDTVKVHDIFYNTFTVYDGNSSIRAVYGIYLFGLPLILMLVFLLKKPKTLKDPLPVRLNSIVADIST